MGPARRFVVFIAAFAFALQSFITQTHVHDASRSFVGFVKIADAHAPAQTRPPLDHHPAYCPICQAVIHAGVFVASAGLLLHLPFLWVRTATPALAAHAESVATAHDWQSRAPPHA